MMDMMDMMFVGFWIYGLLVCLAFWRIVDELISLFMIYERLERIRKSRLELGCMLYYHKLHVYRIYKVSTVH